MILAAVLTVGAYLLASLGRTSSLPANAGPFLGVVIGLLIVAHIATRRLAPNADGTLLPLAARNINGARLWVRVGGISFQPGEFAKVTLCIFLASYLVEKRELLSVGTRRIGGMVVPDLKYFGPILLAWGFSMVVLVAERDLGSSVLFFALFLAMLWVATARSAYLLIGGAMFAVGSLAAVKSFAHVHERISIWLNPWPV